MSVQALGADRTLLLVRHGRTALNADGRLRGHLDPGLDEVGRVEVAELADSLAALTQPRQVARIVTSPLLRAVQTAHAISQRAGAVEQVAPGLIDRDYGRWAGEPTDSVLAEFGSLDRADGVEPAATVSSRARAVLQECRSLAAEGPVVLVSHDAVNRLVLAALDPGLGPWEQIHQRTACWNVLVATCGGWKVLAVDRKARPSHR